MSTELAKTNNQTLPTTVEQVLVQGDLSKLDANGRIQYYNAVCNSLKLNPLTRPFEYLTLNGKLQLYARKDCTEQLRNIHAISLTLTGREAIEGVYVVTAKASRPDGRLDEATGAVPIEGLKGEARANAYLKAETKAKRRVTLSICGLGLLDESEVESIPDAKPYSEPVAPVATTKPQRIEAIQDAPGIPSEVQEMYRIMAAKKGQGFAEVFANLQDQLVSLLGQTRGIEEYNHTLGLHGVDSWQAFKTLGAGKKCVLALYEKIQSIQVQSDGEPVEADLFAQEVTA